MHGACKGTSIKERERARKKNDRGREKAKKVRERERERGRLEGEGRERERDGGTAATCCRDRELPVLTPGVTVCSHSELHFLYCYC